MSNQNPIAFKSLTPNQAATKLTADNYYDLHTDQEYQSATFFKQFETCEAATLAIINGDWTADEDQLNFLVGNYVHSYFESPDAHASFLDLHADSILAKTGKHKGQPLQKFNVADTMIQTLEADEAFNRLYQGDKEVIVTGTIDGVLWKGKIDCLNLEKHYFVDLKTTQDLHKRFYNVKDHKWQPFVLEYNYPLQMAIYQELIYQTFNVRCTPYIVAVTKQANPDKAVIAIEDKYIKAAREEVAARQPHIEAVKAGLTTPHRCEQCAYCRATKHLTDFIYIDDLLADE